MALSVDNTAVNSDVELPAMFQEAYWLSQANADDPQAEELQDRAIAIYDEWS